MKRLKPLNEFKNHHLIVFIAGLISLTWILICTFFKASPILNLPSTLMRYFGEASLNIAYSVFAAVIFFFFHDFYSNLNIIKAKEKHFIENRIKVTNKINIYLELLDKIYKGNLEERGQLNNLRYCYIGIETFIKRSFELYEEVIPSEIYDAMNNIINNSLFEAINWRINGKIKGKEFSVYELIYGQQEDYKKLVKALKKIQMKNNYIN